MSKADFEPIASKDFLRERMGKYQAKGDFYGKPYKWSDDIWEECFKVWEEYPLTRASVPWRAFGRTGLSPFGFAGVTKVEPKKILEEWCRMHKEMPYCQHIFLCSDTLLPILSVNFAVWNGFTKPYYWKGVEHTVEDLIKDYRLCVDEIPCDDALDDEDDWDRDPAPSSPEDIVHGFPRKELYLEALLAKFGGEGWEKKCHRRFDPFKMGAWIKLDEWKELREFYLGRELKN